MKVKGYEIKSGADLRAANLRGANLRDADLRDADLRDADLRGADLEDALLRGANLQGADLRGADLEGAYLRGAYLRGAYLRDANLRWASLEDADLPDANLRGANLRDADLRGANLQAAYLRGAEWPPFQIPQEGALTVWKKLDDGHIAQLEIPPGAARTASLVGRKCRAESALVLAIYDGEGAAVEKPVGGWRDYEFQYKAGRIVEAGNYDPDPRVECAGGIHFFLTREEAVAW